MRQARPPRPILLAALAALAATVGLAAVAQQPVARDAPPTESGQFREPDLVELVSLDPSIHLDIRYATPNNLTGRAVYPEARAFLQRPAAEAIVRVSAALKASGYGLAVFDAYRPWAITKVFWDVTPADKKKFVADPAVGSKHNRGCAVDLTLYDLKTGREVEMPSEFDEMTDRSAAAYPGGPADRRARRDVLRRAMEAEGFEVYPDEWWHFDYRDWQKYRIQNVSFADIR
jgi:zinc D-Ala-D-Ala dipeptidase